jgi:hypothetical protein
MMLLLLAVLVVASSSLAPHHQLSNATGRAGWALPFSVSDDGSIQVQIDGHAATISSAFTTQAQLCAFGHTPYGAHGGWSRPLTVDRSIPGRVRVQGTAENFSVDRLVVAERGRLLVNDTIKVLRVDARGSATAVQQSHSATFGPGSEINYTSVDGPNNEYPAECVSESSGMYGNPSVFLAAQRGSGRHVGVGLLALDVRNRAHTLYRTYGRSSTSNVFALSRTCSACTRAPSMRR